MKQHYALTPGGAALTRPTVRAVDAGWASARRMPGGAALTRPTIRAVDAVWVFCRPGKLAPSGVF